MRNIWTPAARYPNSVRFSKCGKYTRQVSAKNEIRPIYRKNERHSFCTVIFSNGFQLFLQLSTRSRSAFFSFYPSLFRQQQPFLKMSLLRSRWLKMVSPTIPRQKKLSEAEIHFCSSRRSFFNNPPGHIHLHSKMNCSSSRLGIYIDTSAENIQETLPFIFLFRIPENTGKAHIYQGERKMNSSRRHPPNFFNMASIVKKQGNFFSFFRIPPSFFKTCLLWKEAETAAGVQNHPIFRELNGLRGDMFLSEKLNFYFSLFPFWVSDRFLKKIEIRSSTCITQYR